MDTLLAAIPLIVVLALMVGLRWSGSKAGAAGWLTSLVIALLRFGVGPEALFWAQIQGLFRAGYVLYIIWGALLFFRVTEADGTLSAMSDMLQKLAPGRVLQVLLLAWGFTSFLQGVGGFGVPVAVVAPILVSMGFPALDAVVMASLGHSWAISFGSLGASYEALTSTTGLDGAVIGPWMALMLSIVCFTVGVIILRLAAGKKMLREELGPMLTMAAAMTLTQAAAVYAGIPNIAAMLGALAGILVGTVWAIVRRRRSGEGQAEPVVDRKAILRLLPYALLVVVIFAVNFIPLLNAMLNRLVVAVQVPALTLRDGTQIAATRTKGISILGHPGAQLVYAAIIALLLARRSGNLPQGSGERIRKGVLKSGTKSTLGILAMMAMATTMQVGGMVSELATSMAALAGRLFPLISPWIGALGAFMTGSNTNSNVLLGAFQLQVAQTLGLHVPLVLALHNAGAAVGSIFAPAKIIVGCSTVGLGGGESEALQKTTRYGLIGIAVLAVVGIVLTQLVPGVSP